VIDTYLRKVIVITGGSSGIGYGIAELFAVEGAHLFILARKASLTKNLSENLQAKHQACKVDLISCDISDSEQVCEAMRMICSSTTVVDLLVNNAGYATYELFEGLAFEEAVRLAATNFTGHIAVTSALLPLLRRAKNGHICFVNSVAGVIPITPNSVYGAAKQGMEGFANLLRHELKTEGINITSVFPGRIETPFFNHPTFQKRNAGAETKLTIPIDLVCEKIVAGLKKRKNKIFIPVYWRVVAYLYNIDPIFFGRLYDWVLERRLKSFRIDLQKNKNV